MGAVRGLHLSVPKVPAPAGALGRHQFVPGVPHFDAVQFEAALSSGGPGGGTGSNATTQYLEAWATGVAQGLPDLRDADITLLSSSLATVGVIRLVDLNPVSGLDPFPISGRRSITLEQARFEFNP